MTNFTYLRSLPRIALLFLLLPFARLHAQPALSLDPVITTGLSSPLDVVNAGDGTNRLFVVERGGTIKVFDASYNPLGNFLTVTGITAGGEQGLLSLAFHPNYSTNGFFFVYYTNTAGDVEIARYHVQSANPNQGDPATRTVLLTIPKSETNHNGGKLNFGSDGYLYFGVGDGGGAGDADNNAQNSNTLLGKMVRIDVNNFTTPPYYSIPPSNPYVNATDTLHAIYAFGLRNPWRWSFDRSNGDLWLADVGQSVAEEINYLPANATAKVNYGWRCYEGTATYNSSGCLSQSQYVSPVFTYPHNNTTGGFAVTGGYVYRGTQFPTLAGYYICADYLSDNIWLIRPNGAAWEVTQQGGLPGGIAGFGETESGEMMAVSLTGILYQVAVASALPVTMLSFTADAQSGYNELRWKTVREVDLQSFFIEFSTDGSTWTGAGSVLATRKSTDADYFYKHPTNYYGTIFYRLKMIDLDSSFSYSRVISVDTDPGRGKEMQLFPTAVSYGQLQVQLSEPFVNMQVFNMQGQILMVKNLQNQTGVIRIDVSNFNKGMYTVVVSRPDKTISKTFMIQ